MVTIRPSTQSGQQTEERASLLLLLANTKTNTKAAFGRLKLNSTTLFTSGINPSKTRRWVCVWLVRHLPGVIVLYKFLHGLHTALADVPEVLLQRGLDGTLQGLILCYQHLCNKAKHFTFLIVHLEDTHIQGFEANAPRVKSEREQESRQMEKRKWERWRERKRAQVSEKSCHAFPITTEWINNQWKCSHANCSQVLCVPEYRFLWTFLHQLPVARLPFLQCLYNPATMEIWKARGHLFRQVGGNTHTCNLSQTSTQPMSTASCDVCHIEDGIKARVGASCDRGGPW